MKSKPGLFIFSLIFVAAVTACKQEPDKGRIKFNSGWEFLKDGDTTLTAHHFKKGNTPDLNWEKVSLPHTACIEPLVNRGNPWQGYCFYRKFFKVPADYAGRSVMIEFEGAMQVAEVFLNGFHIATHLGGYLPFVVDISDKVMTGGENCLVVRLNNLDNSLVPPGKPTKDLDFCYYSGIYRNVSLIVKDKTHITHPMFANRMAGGGIYVTFRNVSNTSATVKVNVDVQNDHADARNIKTLIYLDDNTGKRKASAEIREQTIQPGMNARISHELFVKEPILWSPENPYLYNTYSEDF